MSKKNRKELKKIVGCICWACISLVLQSNGMEVEGWTPKETAHGKGQKYLGSLEPSKQRMKYSIPVKEGIEYRPPGMLQEMKPADESSDDDNVVEIYWGKPNL